jgi:hypothetical protein
VQADRKEKSDPNSLEKTEKNKYFGQERGFQR